MCVKRGKKQGTSEMRKSGQCVLWYNWFWRVHRQYRSWACSIVCVQSEAPWEQTELFLERLLGISRRRAQIPVTRVEQWMVRGEQDRSDHIRYQGNHKRGRVPLRSDWLDNNWPRAGHWKTQGPSRSFLVSNNNSKLDNNKSDNNKLEGQDLGRS